jgi:predicted component of type VI protein secretion system
MKMMVIFILKASVFLGFVIFLHACDTLKTAKETKNLPIPKKISVKLAARPLLDISAPNLTETATFALG